MALMQTVPEPGTKIRAPRVRSVKRAKAISLARLIRMSDCEEKASEKFERLSAQERKAFLKIHPHSCMHKAATEFGMKHAVRGLMENVLKHAPECTYNTELGTVHVYRKPDLRSELDAREVHSYLSGLGFKRQYPATSGAINYGHPSRHVISVQGSQYISHLEPRDD